MCPYIKNIFYQVLKNQRRGVKNMFKKIFVISMTFVITLISVSFAGVSHYSTNIIMPKNSGFNPATGTQPTAQVYNSQSNAQTTEPQATQLTPEQLYEMQKAQALKAMQEALANGNNATQNAEMQALANAMLDIPSGFTNDGFAYGLARLAHNLSLKRGEVNFVSATKIKDKQYYVVCDSADRYANGTFLVDIFPANEAELKDGYQLWFTLYDINAKKLGTAQAKKMHN